MPPPDGNDVMKALHALHGNLQREMRERFDRDLPFEELVFDRWERAKALGFGARASIYHNAYVFGDVRVGADTWIGPFVMLDGSGGRIEIGEWCSISPGVHVYTHDTIKRSLTGGNADADRAPVQIGDRSYVGSQVVVLPGARIGHHCVVAAGSLVNCEILPHSIAAGVPARIRGRVAIDESSHSVELEWDD
jgi:acetyltransferase-like isoleucine patch superfamily enzyme